MQKADMGSAAVVMRDTYTSDIMAGHTQIYAIVIDMSDKK